MFSHKDNSVAEENVAKFTLNGKIHVIKIDLKTQYLLTDKFDFNILKMFFDDNLTREMMLKLLLDTEFCLKLLWFFIEKKVEYSHDDMLDHVGTADGLDEFKEAVWAAIVNFSSKLTRPALIEMWSQLKHKLRTFKPDLETSPTSSSESEVEE